MTCLPMPSIQFHGSQSHPVVNVEVKLVIFQRVAAVLVRRIHTIIHQPHRARQTGKKQ